MDRSLEANDQFVNGPVRAALRGMFFVADGDERMRL
jgi:hypothetical protein